MIKYKTLFIGSTCNNRCVFCPHTGERLDRSLEEILDEMGAPEGPIDSLELVGGDPAIRSDLSEIVARARESGWRRIKMVTNGRAFADPRAVATALRSGLRAFEIKLCGPAPEIHDALTRAPGSFMETVQGLRSLRDVQVADATQRFIGLWIPIVGPNYVHLPQTVSIAVGLGVDRVTLSFDNTEVLMSEAVPYVMAAIDTGLVNSVWVQTEGIPLCLMGGYEHHVREAFAHSDAAGERAKACASCAYTTCAGISLSYAEARGTSEFVAVIDSVYAAQMSEGE